MTGDPWWLSALRWPLWSWRRLVFTVLVFVVVTASAGSVRGLLVAGGGTPGAGSEAGTLPASGPTAAVSPAGASTAATTAAAGPGAVGTSGATNISTGPEPVTAALARSFVTAWARPDLSVATWFAALEPLSTSRLAQQLRTTDPGRVPATRVVGVAPGGASATSPTGTTQVLVETDAGTVAVTLTRVGGRWRVDAIDPARQPPDAESSDWVTPSGTRAHPSPSGSGG